MKWVRTGLVLGILAMGAQLVWADGIIAEYEVRQPEVMLNLSAVEFVVLFVEAAAYLAIIGLTLARALLTSVAANGASMVAAFAVGHRLWAVAEPGPRQSALLVGLLVTLAMELPIVAAMNRDFPNRRGLLGGALALNLLTYAAATTYIKWLVTFSRLL